jgi:hypothetical protein
MAEVLSVQQKLEQQPGLLLPPEAETYLELMEMGRKDGMTVWRAPGVERRDGSEIEGQGLFAVESIPQNTLIAIKPGLVLTSQKVKANADVINGSQQQIGPNQFLAGTTPEEVDKNLVGYNHSCNPNAKVILFKGASMAFLVTREPIKVEDEPVEITVDYAVSQMTNTHLMQFCQCGSPQCRGFVAPLWDWEDEALQGRYEGEFAWFIQEAIDEQKQRPTAELLAKRKVHTTLKYAGMTVLADGEVERLEAQREKALYQLDSKILRSILGRYFDRRPAGQEIQYAKDLRLKAAAYFAVICDLGNIDEMGIDRSEVMTALLTDSSLAVTAETLRDTSLAPHLEGVVKFARNLDYLFNE